MGCSSRFSHLHSKNDSSPCAVVMTWSKSSRSFTITLVSSNKFELVLTSSNPTHLYFRLLSARWSSWAHSDLDTCSVLPKRMMVMVGSHLVQHDATLTNESMTPAHYSSDFHYETSGTFLSSALRWWLVGWCLWPLNVRVTVATLINTCKSPNY